MDRRWQNTTVNAEYKSQKEGSQRACYFDKERHQISQSTVKKVAYHTKQDNITAEA